MQVMMKMTVMMKLMYLLLMDLEYQLWEYYKQQVIDLSFDQNKLLVLYKHIVHHLLVLRCMMLCMARKSELEVCISMRCIIIRECMYIHPVALTCACLQLQLHLVLPNAGNRSQRPLCRAQPLAHCSLSLAIKQ